MLMDNKGGANLENQHGANGIFGGANEMLPEEKADFENYVDQREDLKPNMEMPAEFVDNDNSAETVSEQQSSAMPAPAPAPMSPADEEKKKDEETKEELSAIKVPRDAQNLPKAYEKAVSKIVSRNSKNPRRLVSEMDIARWDLMEKAFGRKRGDGLNGTGNA